MPNWHPVFFDINQYQSSLQIKIYVHFVPLIKPIKRSMIDLYEFLLNGHFHQYSSVSGVEFK